MMYFVVYLLFGLQWWSPAFWRKTCSNRMSENQAFSQVENSPRRIPLQNHCVFSRLHTLHQTPTPYISNWRWNHPLSQSQHISPPLTIKMGKLSHRKKRTTTASDRNATTTKAERRRMKNANYYRKRKPAYSNVLNANLLRCFSALNPSATYFNTCWDGAFLIGQRGRFLLKYGELAAETENHCDSGIQDAGHCVSNSWNAILWIE